jgi:hypothetical protein
MASMSAGKDMRQLSGRQHDGDCASWSGSISCFVKSFQTAKLSGLVGQSPLPVYQTARLFGQVGQSPLPERSAPNWQAARWRLRFVVGVDQLLREIISDCQTLRPGWTVAATGLSDCKTLRPGWKVAATGSTRSPSLDLVPW